MAKNLRDSEFNSNRTGNGGGNAGGVASNIPAFFDGTATGFMGQGPLGVSGATAVDDGHNQGGGQTTATTPTATGGVGGPAVDAPSMSNPYGLGSGGGFGGVMGQAGGSYRPTDQLGAYLRQLRASLWARYNG